MEAIYRRRNPAKLNKLPGWLKKYQGRENVLYIKACKEYQLDPKKRWDQPEAWDYIEASNTDELEGEDDSRAGNPKVWRELNAYEPPSFNTNKGKMFCCSAALLAPPVLIVSVTYVFTAFVFAILVISFPIWGVALLIAVPFHASARQALGASLEAHAQIWGYIGVLLLLFLFAIHIREGLWQLQKKLTGTAPQGDWGYNAACTQVLFAMPCILVLQTSVSWSILLRSGRSIGEIPMAPFNARVLHEYNACLFSSASPLQVRLINWVGLA